MSRDTRTYNYSEVQKNRRPKSICWHCANAVPTDKMGCCWSKHFEPVPGWDAECTDDYHRKTLAEGEHVYFVKDCPEFIPDTPEFARLAARHDEGMNALAIDVIKIAVIDFIPVYRRYVQVRMDRGYRFVWIDGRLLKLHIRHHREMAKIQKKKRKEIRCYVRMLTEARKKFVGCPKALEAISLETKRMYEIIASMRIPSDDREQSVYGSYKSLKRFFCGDYAFHLSELDTVVLMKKVMRQVEDEMDIPQMDSIIRPNKRLKKGLVYGTGR